MDIYVDLPTEIDHGSYFVEYKVFDDAMVVQEDPISYTKAINSSQKDQGQEAMQVEYDFLISKRYMDSH